MHSESSSRGEKRKSGSLHQAQQTELEEEHVSINNGKQNKKRKTNTTDTQYNSFIL